MRLLSLVTLAAVGAGMLAAQSDKTAAREAVIYNGPRVSANTWMWTDKNTYNPGQTATIRRSIKANSDLYPYTQVLYVVNNQTGAKTYLPGNSGTVTDITGAALGSFAAAPLTDQTRQQIGTFTIPDSLGMHTVVWELRDYSGGRVLKANYMKIGVVSGQETVTGEITSNRTLTNDKEWLLSGVVMVKNNAVLTIEPGTFIKGQASPTSALIVTSAGRIHAVGTPGRPITMTSNLALGQRSRGNWGGLAMLGRAQVNITGGSSFLEGLPTGPDTQYGGTDNAHSCGSLAYLRVEFAGSVLGEGNELNGITFAGCGTGTSAHHLQSSFGEDDAFEWFGGTMHADHLLAFGQEDDQLDIQLGFEGSVDHFVGFQYAANKGNRCIEADNNGTQQGGPSATPFTNATIFNVTCIGTGETSSGEGDVAAARLRQGLRGYYGNLVLYQFLAGAIRITETQTITNSTDGTLRANGILLWRNGANPNTTNTRESNLRGTAGPEWAWANSTHGLNLKLGNPMFASLEPNDPDFQGLFGSAMYQPVHVRAPGRTAQNPPDANSAAEYYGGVGPDDNWPKAEWTFYVRDADMVGQ